VITFVAETGAGLSNATSYVTVAEADDIAALNIHSAAVWAALDNATKQNLLMYVTRVLDSRTTWEGTKAVTAQALEWPRTDVVDRYSSAVASNVVPYNVRWAVVELAKFTMADDRLAKWQPDNAILSAKVDTITVQFADPTLLAVNMYRTPPIVTDLLKGLGKVRNSNRRITFGALIS
jgi:hypothetical protein